MIATNVAVCFGLTLIFIDISKNHTLSTKDFSRIIMIIGTIGKMEITRQQESNLECEVMNGKYKAGDMEPLGIRVVNDINMEREGDTLVNTVSLSTIDTLTFQKMPSRGLG